jgi:hypothetical protein
MLPFSRPLGTLKKLVTGREDKTLRAGVEVSRQFTSFFRSNHNMLYVGYGALTLAPFMHSFNENYSAIVQNRQSSRVVLSFILRICSAGGSHRQRSRIYLVVLNDKSHTITSDQSSQGNVARHRLRWIGTPKL